MTPIEAAAKEAEGLLKDARALAVGFAQVTAFTKASTAFTRAARLATEARDLTTANAMMARANDAKDAGLFAQKAAQDGLAKMKAAAAVGSTKGRKKAASAVRKWAAKPSND